MTHTGVIVVSPSDEDTARWFTEGTLPLANLGIFDAPQNCGVVLKMNGKKEHGLVKGDKVKSVTYVKAFGVEPKNTEQVLAMNMLLDKDIKLKTITGREGVGKNYITAACALHMLLETKQFNKLILTRTTDEVGKSLGLFPGSSSEKFANHMASFEYTFKAMVDDRSYIDHLMEKKIIEFVPIQLMRGISFPPGTLVWADEIAGLSPFELRMLGTRLGENCALILTGSFEQIDRRIAAENCGLHKLVNNQRVMDSSLSGYIELMKNERSALSKLIGDAL